MDVDVLGFTDAGIESEDEDTGTDETDLSIFCWRKSGASSNTDKGKFHYIDGGNSNPSYKKILWIGKFPMKNSASFFRFPPRLK